MIELQNQMQQAHAFAPPGLGFAAGIPPAGGGGPLNYQMDPSQAVTPVGHPNYAPILQTALQAHSNLASQGAPTPTHDRSQVIPGQQLNGPGYPNQSQLYEHHFPNHYNQPNYAAHLSSQHQEPDSSLHAEREDMAHFEANV